MTIPSSGSVLPLDEYNRILIDNVHPTDRVNPTPQDSYDLVVIGAGTAGLVVAAGAAGLGLGLKVALIEKHLMGGDCLNTGCIPSKCLVRSARVVGVLWQAPQLGIKISDDIEVDFAEVMTRMRQVRSGISQHDSVQRFQELGIDVFLGQGSFSSHKTIEIDGQTLRFKKAVIATGARAMLPNIPGIEEVGALTNETVFSLTQRPDRLAVIGGGPIGCELAQAFCRLGCEVILLQRDKQLLTKEDPAAAQIIEQTLMREGIRLILGCQIERVAQTGSGKTKTIYFQENGQTAALTVDEILIGVGRQPNVAGLNLAAAGVAYHAQQGVQINDYLQTTNPQIYAAGDICMDWKFTHAADAAARLVIRNAFFSPWGLGRSKLSSLVMPWVTFTDPEIAHVGLSQQAAAQQQIAINTIHIPLSQVDRAITDGETVGFLEIHLQPGTDQILGGTIVASHAGEMISIITTAIANKLGLNALSGVIYPYPTQAECIKKAADAYRRTLLTTRTKQLLKFLTKFS
jgi:pyruvate/2-oxoglutarate dehydrogenase complex dihydrolipoamide dehydrogenase (E3) component